MIRNLQTYINGQYQARLMVTRTNHLFSVAFQFWKNAGKPWKNTRERVNDYGL